MPIDPRIALGVQPLQLPQQDPNQGLNSLARMMQIKSSMQEGDMNALKMQELQRGVDETNRLNSIYGGAVGPDGSIDRTKLFGGLASGNLGSKIPGIQKQLLEADEARYKLQNEAAKGYKLFQATVGSHAASPAPSRDGVAASVQALVAAGAMDGGVAGRLLQAMPSDPEQLRQYLRQAATSQMDPKDMLTVFAPKPTEVDNGQQKVFRDTNPLSTTYGQSTAGAAVQKVATPDAMLSSTTSIENNKRTVGASLANAAATREIANATRDSARIQANQNTEMKMGDDYRAQSKPFKEVADAYRQINSTLDKAATSPAATLAAATKFMKLLDPGSVVRESELGMALAASGVIDRLTNYHNTLSHGKVLTPNQVQDFKQITQQIYTAAQQQQQQIDGNYRRQAETYGLRPNMVVQDLGQNTTPPVDLHALPSGGKSSGKVVNFGDLK